MDSYEYIEQSYNRKAWTRYIEEINAYNYRYSFSRLANINTTKGLEEPCGLKSAIHMRTNIF